MSQYFGIEFLVLLKISLQKTRQIQLLYVEKFTLDWVLKTVLVRLKFVVIICSECIFSRPCSTLQYRSQHLPWLYTWAA